MSNVESAAAAGDNYNLRHVLLADGTGAVVGSALGSPFPPAVYVGHPGWKAAGGGISYSLATGMLIFILCFFGLFPLLGALLPVPAIVPVLLYIGLVIGAQAFRAVPKAHYAAIVLALVPNVAAWASGLIDNSLAAAGTSAGEGRPGGARQRGRRLRGAAEARSGGGPRGPDPRRDRGVHDRPAVPLGGRVQLPRGRAVSRRADPRRGGVAVARRHPGQARARLRAHGARVPRRSRAWASRSGRST